MKTDLWQQILARANEVLAMRRGAKSEVAKALGIGRQEMRRILNGEREPHVTLALDLWQLVEEEAKNQLKKGQRTRTKAPTMPKLPKA